MAKRPASESTIRAFMEVVYPDAGELALCSFGGETILRDATELIKRLRQWINDLQAGMYINCVYCGHRYGPDDEVPATMAQMLKDHIEQCPEHPMSKLKARMDIAVATLKEAEEIIGQGIEKDALPIIEEALRKLTADH